MTTYATQNFMAAQANVTGAEPIVLLRITLTTPTTQVLNLSTREVTTPDGTIWEPAIIAVGPIAAQLSDVLDPGPSLATCPIVFANRRISSQPSEDDKLSASLAGYDWQGARAEMWLWYSSLTNFTDDALPMIAGPITSVSADVQKMSISIKQDTDWNGSIPDIRITRADFPNAPEASIGNYLPIIIGSRIAEGMGEPFDTPYGLKDYQNKVGGGTLVNPGIVTDTGRDGGDLRVYFASNVVSVGGTSDKRMFIRASDKLAMIDPAAMVYGADAVGQYAEIAADSLRAFAGVLMLDSRVSSTTALYPLNALDVYVAQTYAYLDGPSGFDRLQVVIPNVSSEGQYLDVGNVAYSVCYSTTSSNLRVRLFNIPTTGYGVATSLPSTGTLESPTVVYGDATGILPEASTELLGTWDFGGNGTTKIRDLVVDFSASAANNFARIFWIALQVKYRPNKYVIYPGREQALGGPATYDIMGRRIKRNLPGSRTWTVGNEAVAGRSELRVDFFANIEGTSDDVSGTYTGTPSALIERPADILRWMLANYGGVALSKFETDATAFGSFVLARSKIATIDGNLTSFATCLKDPADIGTVASGLAREASVAWFINRFTGRHNIATWSLKPQSVNYDRVLTADALVGADKFIVELPGEGYLAQRVAVQYGWDAYQNSQLHTCVVGPDESIGGYAQTDARDQAVVVKLGVNDQLDWREGSIAGVNFGGTAGNNRIQVPTYSTEYSIGQTVIDPYPTPYWIPAGTTITALPDSTHLDLSANLLHNATWPNQACTIQDRYNVTVDPGNYVPIDLCVDLRTKMKAVSTDYDIKVDWGAYIKYEYNDLLPIAYGGLTYNVQLTEGEMTMAERAADVQRALIEGTPIKTWTCQWLTGTRQFEIRTNGAAVVLDWQYSAQVENRCCANVLGFPYDVSSYSGTTFTGFARRNEAFVFSRAGLPGLALLFWTGDHASATMASALGFLPTKDYGGTLSVVGDFRRSAREIGATSSVDAHGSKPEISLSASWINASEPATTLRDTTFDWLVEPRYRIKFATLGFVDCERGMTFKTDASLDEIMPYPRRGSDKSWANRVWQVLEVHQYLGDNWHQEIVAVETSLESVAFTTQFEEWTGTAYVYGSATTTASGMTIVSSAKADVSGSATTAGDGYISGASTEFWVSQSRGDDGNPGTYADPWATIGQANSDAASGSTVFVEDGSYYDLPSKDTVTFIGNETNPLAVDLTGNGNITIVGSMIVRGFRADGISLTAASQGGGAYYCHVYDFSAGGNGAGIAAADCTIDHCIFDMNSTFWWRNGGDDHAAVAHISNITISNCTITIIRPVGIEMEFFRMALVDDCHITDCTITMDQPDGQTNDNSAFFKMYECVNNTFTRCIFYLSGVPQREGASEPYFIYLRDETTYNTFESCEWYDDSDGVSFSFSPNTAGSITCSANHNTYSNLKFRSIGKISFSQCAIDPSDVFTNVQFRTNTFNWWNADPGMSGVDVQGYDVPFDTGSGVQYGAASSSGSATTTGSAQLVSSSASADSNGSATTSADGSVTTSATVYYVDSVNGLDTNPGTSGSPWQTIGKANSVVTLGTTIYVATGSYAEAPNVAGTTWVGNTSNPNLVNITTGVTIIGTMVLSGFHVDGLYLTEVSQGGSADHCHCDDFAAVGAASAAPSNCSVMYCTFNMTSTFYFHQDGSDQSTSPHLIGLEFGWNTIIITRAAGQHFVLWRMSGVDASFFHDNTTTFSHGDAGGWSADSHFRAYFCQGNTFQDNQWAFLGPPVSSGLPYLFGFFDNTSGNAFSGEMHFDTSGTGVWYGTNMNGTQTCSNTSNVWTYCGWVIFGSMWWSPCPDVGGTFTGCEIRCNDMNWYNASPQPTPGVNLKNYNANLGL